ncbi:hypothetical protein [Candidatus Burkholderia verschuerenii]|uniref:hypothetical protein n=1 Tax=Candidatus Burkholderia verschuerenii TaxID=242163 RepID=UPI0012EEBB52|nr:hypothetical protein [Candidatus Burkholderia verschuerenii]
MKSVNALPEHLKNLDWDELISMLADAPDDIKALIEKHLETNDERISEASHAWFADRGYGKENASAADSSQNEARVASKAGNGYRNEPRYQCLAEGFVPAHSRGK